MTTRLLMILTVTGLLLVGGATNATTTEKKPPPKETEKRLSVEILRRTNEVTGHTRLLIIVKGNGIQGTNLLGHPTDVGIPPMIVLVKTNEGDALSFLIHVDAKKTKIVTLGGAWLHLSRVKETNLFRDSNGHAWERTNGKELKHDATTLWAYGELTWQEGAWTFQEVEGSKATRSWKRVDGKNGTKK